MPITLASPIAGPSTTGYDVTQFSVDFTEAIIRVVLNYTNTGSSGGGTVRMTVAQFEATMGTGTFHARCNNALAGQYGLNLVGATVT